MNEFTEAELLELLTAVADQRSYYKAALKTGSGSQKLYREKYFANDALYKKLQSMLLAIETAETL